MTILFYLACLILIANGVYVVNSRVWKTLDPYFIGYFISTVGAFAGLLSALSTTPNVIVSILTIGAAIMTTSTLFRNKFRKPFTEVRA
jgi:hypothetical protein